MIVEKSLLTKYNQPVPRYTSYPPANFFGSQSEEAHLRMIEESNHRGTQQISFYFHIPFCRKSCWYCGCNSLPMASLEVQRRYKNALLDEIDLIARRIDKKRLVSQIHYGGGTPNLFPSEWIAEINEKVYSLFQLSDHAEVAMECHPAYLTLEYIDQLKNIGFNRFSLGIQDFNPDVLEMVRRDPPFLPIADLVDRIRNHGVPAKVNFDFIYGLPGQTVELFLNSMEKAVSLNPDRLVTFSYAHVPWVNPTQQGLERYGLPSSELKMDIFNESHKFLIANGYREIGLDHYVREDDDLYKALENKKLHRNFQGYCTRETTGQVYAFGISAISQFDAGYSQNTKQLVDYLVAIESGHLATVKGFELSAEQYIIREVLTHIMCNMQIQWDSVADYLKISKEQLIDLFDLQSETLHQMERDGILKLNENGLQITEVGKLFVRNVAAALDPLYQFKSNQFSKSV